MKTAYLESFTSVKENLTISYFIKECRACNLSFTRDKETGFLRWELFFKNILLYK